jgi:phage-related minor tail protein
MANERFPDDFSRELGDVSLELKRVGDLADSVGRSLTNAFRGASLDGRSLKGVLGEVARGFADIALKAALKPVGTLISGAVESLFTATNPALQGVTPFAKGGVLAAPSYFPTGRGLGVAGEAGAEAVLPLARGSDGRLGVASGGGGGVQVTFNVTASDARSFAASEAELSAMLLRAVRRGTRAS